MLIWKSTPESGHPCKTPHWVDEEVNEEELIRAAINGMLTSLDPHSSYLPPSDFDQMKVQTRGEFGGLGIEGNKYFQNSFYMLVSA